MSVRIYLFLLLQLTALAALAQHPPSSGLSPINGAPSAELFDLLHDRKGHLWMTHNAGISRYDGRSFTSYSTAGQNARAMTDLCEDRQGRIWCHNFEGQIFYIEQQQLHLLPSYRFREEDYFPRTAIFGDELLATSSNGLFICNTATMKTRYLTQTGATTSLAVLSDGALVLSTSGIFYWYDPQKGLRPLRCGFRVSKGQNISLQPDGKDDTAHLISNPEAVLYRMVRRGDSLLVLPPEQAPMFINSVTVDHDEVWVHTNELSWNNKGQRIYGQALSHALRHPQGPYFYSSLRKGLLTMHQGLGQKIRLPFPDTSSLVTALHPLAANGFLYGTATGSIYETRDGRMLRSFRLPSFFRAVERIVKLADNQYLIGASQGILSLDLNQGSLTTLDYNIVLKDAATGKGRALIAATFRILQADLPAADRAQTVSVFRPLGSRRRCRSIEILSDGTVLAAFNDGLRALQGDASRQLSFRGQQIYATRIRSFGRHLLIGTFNHGLLVRSGGNPLSNWGIAPEPYARVISDIRVTRHAAWILYDDLVELLDTALKTRRLDGLPFRGADVLDVAEDSNGYLFATKQGLYRLPRIFPRLPQPHTVLDYLLVHGRRRAPVEPLVLAHDSNSFSIGLSTAYFSANSSLRYRYRLSTPEEKGNWLVAGEGQSSFSFVNLAKGSYTFEALPVSANGEALSESIRFPFVIRPAWYETWWAYLGGLALLLGLFFVIGLYLHRERLRKQEIRYEKMLAVEQERQRISAEIHDDLGASLSGVRLLAELVREKTPDGTIRRELEKIHESITGLTQKTREVIWALNSDYDSLESLLLYIQKQAQSLFEGSPIHLQVQLPTDIPTCRISGEIRRQIYLAVKEALHNCLKHAQAGHCLLSAECGGHRLHVVVADDGQGFVPKQSASFSSGMQTMRQRMESVGGTLQLSTEPGLRVTFTIPLNRLA